MNSEEFEKVYTTAINSGRTIERLLFKEKVLAILRQPIQNADLSWEECDERFIEKIEKL
jgi:hypothetical protein